MKNSFPTLWKEKQKGFITIPILIIAILGSLVVGGGGYAVYKVNKIEQESSSRVTELEMKFEEVNKIATTTEVVDLTDATTTQVVATSSDEVIEKEEAETTVPASIKTSAPVVQQPTVQATPVLPVTVDLCSNLSGLQIAVPDGYKVSGSSCVLREDKCLNITGIQDDIPNGMLLTREYGCISELELDKIETEEKEIRQANEECDNLKTSVYEMDQEMLDIRSEYNAKIKDFETNPKHKGVAREFVESEKQAITNDMYDELELVEIERNKLANEYNYKCVY